MSSKKEPKVMRELHLIREKIYQKIKRMNSHSIVQYFNGNARQYLLAQSGKLSRGS